MDFKAFRELVEKTMSDHPVWFGIESDESPTDTMIAEAEKRLSVELPEDYKNFINAYGGGYFAFSNVYSLEVGSDWNLVDVNYKYDTLRKGFVLFSENGAGDFYGFKVESDGCKSEIYFFDHEVEIWQETSYSNLFEYLKKTALTN